MKRLLWQNCSNNCTNSHDKPKRECCLNTNKCVIIEQMCCPNLRSQDKTRTAFEKATCSSSSRSSSSSSSTAYSLQRLALKQPSAHCAKRADNTFSNRQRLEDHSAHAPAQRVAALIFGARSGAIVVNTCR